MDEFIVNNINQIRSKIKKFSDAGKIVGFVPTMGNLHAGHISLINKAYSECDRVIVSIFINPKQFNDDNDFLSYPKTLESDINILKNHNVSYLFYPDIKDIYPEGFACDISFSSINNKLCAIDREDHFNGVGLILIKLFNIIKPNKVYFGLKDYQQYVLVKNLVSFLNYDIDVVSQDIIREKSGLALSSRNNLLSDNARLNIAPKLYCILQDIKKVINDNQDIDLINLISNYKEKLLRYGFSKIDYLDILDNNLDNYNFKISKNARIFVAAIIENVRLIDNIEL